MAEISDLHHQEGVRLAPDRLMALFARLGDAEAEQAISRTMEELAAQLLLARQAADMAAPDAVAAAAQTLCSLADKIGMVTLARVAQDVGLCAGRGDAAALAATLARLTRIGDRSLSAVWDLQDVIE